MSEKFYITTPIFDVNDKPHIGHAFTMIASDALARYHRLLGQRTFFLTGTDEHGVKIVKAAEKSGLKLQKFTDVISEKFQQLTGILNLSNDLFIRTTDQAVHWPGVSKILKILQEKGDLYKGEYEGLYCIGHEAFLKKSDLRDGVCPDHLTKPEKIKEEKSSDVLFELEPLIVKAPRLNIKQGEPVDSRINYQLLRLLQEKPDLRISMDMENQSPAYKDLNFLVTPNGIRLKTRYTILGLLLTEGLAGANDFQITDELKRLARGDRALQSGSRVKFFALIALAHNHDLSNLGLFQNALRSTVPSERFAAAEALSVWGLPDAISILLGVSKLDTSAVVKIFAAQTVLRLGEPMGKDVLISLLNSDDWVVRAMAMRYLGEMVNSSDYSRILAYFSMETKQLVQAEMCSALLRLHIKRMEAIQKEKSTR